MSNLVKVAIVQAGPVYLDLAQSMEKAVSLIKEAAGMGAGLIAFGETWLPGYPAWLDYCPGAALWDNPATKTVFARLRHNSVVVPGPQTETLSQLAKTLGIVIVMGVNERVETGLGSGTLYNTLLTFGSAGQLLNHHRKLVPTYTERLVWGPGDGFGLTAAETPVGRVGSLVCWEHWMPLTRQTLHQSAEQIHVAAWPGVKEMHQIASRHYAFEGRCFVLAAGLVMTAKELPDEFELPPELAQAPDTLLLNGGSAIIGPDGRYLAGPVFGKETTLTAELDLTEIEHERMTLDTTGHYYRPDVFEFRVKRHRPE
ncbi:MAG: carbon-nitrogen hydrolase family protein [Anaerolineae bacterium]